MGVVLAASPLGSHHAVMVDISRASHPRLPEGTLWCRLTVCSGGLCSLNGLLSLALSQNLNSKHTNSPQRLRLPFMSSFLNASVSSTNPPFAFILPSDLHRTLGVHLSYSSENVSSGGKKNEFRTDTR